MQMRRRCLVSLSVVAMGASEMLRRWSVASLLEGEGWSRKLWMMRMMVVL